MRISAIILALAALAIAQQFPFVDQIKGWFSQATQTISSVVSSATESVSIPNPVASGAAKKAQGKVKRLTVENHEQLLKPGPASTLDGLETWMIFVTGGNKTCFGACGHAERAWNESLVFITVASPRVPNLGLLDCDTDGVLCSAWALYPPQVLHFIIPQAAADQSTAFTTYRSIPLNRTSVTSSEIAELHLHDGYLATTPYEGLFHPFDGILAKNGLLVPFGYVLFGASQIPSWAFMIVVSMVSRSFFGRRLGPQPGRGGAPPAGGAPAGSS